MKTIYIDVYFLINFCVDTLALAIAARFMKMNIGIVRLSIAGGIGASYAVIGILLFEHKYVTFIISIPIFIIMILVATNKAGLMRRIKYTVSFFLSEIIIGGLVYYGYNLLNRIMEHLELSESYIESRNLLILSIILLLSYGVVKLIILFLGNLHSIRSIHVRVKFNGMESAFDALVDTGNLVRDPRGNLPVAFVTRSLAEKILGTRLDLENFDIPEELKRAFRVIPTGIGGDTKILYGFVADDVRAVLDGRCENIDITLAIDMKGESYGGYQALLPASALDNVF